LIKKDEKEVKGKKEAYLFCLFSWESSFLLILRHNFITHQDANIPDVIFLSPLPGTPSRPSSVISRME
jgi:hypothetical protein